MSRAMQRWGWPAILLPFAAACAGGDGGDGGDTGGEAAARTGAHVVQIRMTDEMRFAPENPTISPGDTVVWINEGKMPHTATDKPGMAGVAEHNVLPDGAEPWDSGLLEPGQSFRLVLTAPGDYTYLCFLHEAAGMVGRITVRGGGE